MLGETRIKGGLAIAGNVKSPGRIVSAKPRVDYPGNILRSCRAQLRITTIKR